MSLHHANIAMLRALANQLQNEGDAAVKRSANPIGVLPGVDDRLQTAALLVHLSRACLGAAEHLETEAKALVDRTLPPGPKPL